MLAKVSSPKYALCYFKSSDRPKFGSVPVPAGIKTGTEISVSVPAKFVISVSAGISVQN
jgi:hypothetical protein